MLCDTSRQERRGQALKLLHAVYIASSADFSLLAAPAESGKEFSQ